ncbi:hypothetical protein JCM14036_33510 [Desulfotomaculum defluvii]
MDFLTDNIGKHMIIELAGKTQEGILVDCGLDIAVLFNGQNYVYLPVAHIRHLRLCIFNNLDPPNTIIGPINVSTDRISYRQILERAKGLFIEIAVVGDHLIYGYIKEVFIDYLVFFSPVYNTILVPFEHLKWLCLLNSDQTYYTLNVQDINKGTISFNTAPTFKEQFQHIIGRIIQINMENSPYNSGLLKDITGEFINLITAKEERVFINIKHIQLIQL